MVRCLRMNLNTQWYNIITNNIITNNIITNKLSIIEQFSNSMYKDEIYRRVETYGGAQWPVFLKEILQFHLSNFIYAKIDELGLNPQGF
jgi:hypothetical protein